MDLRREAIPFMKQFIEQWDETCDLSIFDRGEVLYIEVLRGSRALSVAAAVGQRLPAHPTASGRLFLAHLPPNELDAILSQPLISYTKNTVTSPDEIRKELEIIRNQGYAIDNEGFEAGVCAVAPPIDRK
jgi:DNA-binding IclR family transcriptional regulator